MLDPMFTSTVLATYQSLIGGMLAELERQSPVDRSLDWIFRKLIDDLVILRNADQVSAKDATVVAGMIENLADNVGFMKSGQWPTFQ